MSAASASKTHLAPPTPKNVLQQSWLIRWPGELDTGPGAGLADAWLSVRLILEIRDGNPGHPHSRISQRSLGHPHFRTLRRDSPRKFGTPTLPGNQSRAVSPGHPHSRIFRPNSPGEIRDTHLSKISDLSSQRVRLESWDSSTARVERLAPRSSSGWVCEKSEKRADDKTPSCPLPAPSRVPADYWQPPIFVSSSVPRLPR